MDGSSTKTPAAIEGLINQDFDIDHTGHYNTKMLYLYSEV